MQSWYPNTTVAAENNVGFAAQHTVKKPDPKGSFSVAIPLEHIFGFCKDYDKVMYGLRYNLTLVRTSNDDVIFKAVVVGDAGKGKLTKISWMMPNDVMKYKLYKSTEP